MEKGWDLWKQAHSLSQIAGSAFDPPSPYSIYRYLRVGGGQPIAALAALPTNLGSAIQAVKSYLAVFRSGKSPLIS